VALRLSRVWSRSEGEPPGVVVGCGREGSPLSPGAYEVIQPQRRAVLPGWFS